VATATTLVTTTLVATALVTSGAQAVKQRRERVGVAHVWLRAHTVGRKRHKRHRERTSQLLRLRGRWPTLWLWLPPLLCLVASADPTVE
jgi:hypothetical protein